MRIVLITAILTSFLFACGTHSCHKKNNGVLKTLTYALNIMELRQQPDIKLAFAMYKRDVKAINRGLNIDAFKEARFDKEAFIKEHTLYKKLEAQVDLIDTIYIVLNHEQREELHRLMAAHQHYKALLRKESPRLCADKSSCSQKKRCHSKKYCDKKKDCDKKKACGNKNLTIEKE
ncbi:MAG: hypothetical protein U9N52_12955 [Campylobacterota bacterium]|nr:hypothetical protein [Campylobacterota bacterium]